MKTLFPIYSAPAPTNPRTDTGGPPSKVKNPPQSGNYCLRASTTIHDADPDDPYFEIFGYSQDMNIIDHVSQFCDRKKKNLGKGECSNVKLFFMGPRENCNGQIECHTKRKP